MLDKLAADGYVRETTEAEAIEFGRGHVAVLDEHESWHETRNVAEAKLRRMVAHRGPRMPE